MILFNQIHTPYLVSMSHIWLGRIVFARLWSTSAKEGFWIIVLNFKVSRIFPTPDSVMLIGICMYKKNEEQFKATHTHILSITNWN